MKRRINNARAGRAKFLSFASIWLCTVWGCATLAVELRGQVIDVVDGDTLIFVHNDEPERLRLYAIDCPELDQPSGQQAKRAAQEWAGDRVVTVKAWGGDMYRGELTGVVILPDGRNLGHELVRAGLAWWDRRYPEETELARLEAQAKAARRGLWADLNPTPPWEFKTLPQKAQPR